MTPLTPEEERLVNARRVGHLATADSQGAPHVVPVCFAYHNGYFYSVLDEKPKRTPVANLKRVRNILANPQVALVVDHYEEEWSNLWYLLIFGKAQMLEKGDEQQRAVGMLKAKYPQYREMDIDHSPVIKITPTKVVSWGRPST